MGTRYDLVENKELALKKGEEFAKDKFNGCPFIPTSAKENYNIDHALFTAVDLFRNRKASERKRSRSRCVLI